MTPLPTLDRADWLAQRQSGIGASESAAILGISPYASPLDIYLAKTGQVTDREPTEAMRIGLALEPALCELYADRTGQEIAATQTFLRSPSHPFLLATLDAVTTSGRIVELKTASGFMAGEWSEEDDGVPAHYLVQVHQQMIVAGKDEADLAVLIGGSKFKVYTIRRDEILADQIVKAGERFWYRVIHREPPDPTFRDMEAFARVAPHLADTIELDDPSILAEVALYREQVDSIRLSTQMKDHIKGRLVAAMQGHASALLPDGSRITRKEVQRKAYAVEAGSYIDFRVQPPKGAK